MTEKSLEVANEIKSRIELYRSKLNNLSPSYNQFVCNITVVRFRSDNEVNSTKLEMPIEEDLEYDEMLSRKLFITAQKHYESKLADALYELKTLKTNLK